MTSAADRPLRTVSRSLPQRWRSASAVVFALGFFLCLSGCSREGERRELSGGTMGTGWSVVYAHVPGLDQDELQAAIEDDLAAINAAMSTYIADSEISRINRSDGAEPVQLSAPLATVLDAALAVSDATSGAYDVTVGPLVELWGFGAGDAVDAVPPADAVAEAASRVGYRRLALDRQSNTLRRPAGLEIDLSSIAKGYAVDRVLALLREHGVVSALVEIGGELRTLGERPGGGSWRLAVESPAQRGPRVLQALSVRDVAVATSGDYRNYFEVDGIRYSHIVDPRSGYPVTHELVSVTVIDDSCMLADAWATALIVLGREAALSLAEARGLAVYLVTRDGDEIAVEYTDEFAQYFNPDAPRFSAPEH
jgi:thiamine biosynthesis lipoprotein